MEHRKNPVLNQYITRIFVCRKQCDATALTIDKLDGRESTPWRRRGNARQIFASFVTINLQRYQQKRSTKNGDNVEIISGSAENKQFNFDLANVEIYFNTGQ